MKTERRWLKSVLAAAKEPQTAMPWDRGNRRRPAAFAKRTSAAIPPRAPLAAR